MKKIVILTGAGISQESGIATFRDAGGLWEGHKVEDVATPEAFQTNPELVLNFYNERRKAVKNASPNSAHLGLVDLEPYFHTVIITQNVDDLHEKAGSENVIHLHGVITQAKSSKGDSHLQDIEGDIVIGDLAGDGSQLRPHIVWFGEAVPMIDRAMFEIKSADYVMIIGTSMQVYPAAGLVHYAHPNAEIFYIDINAESISGINRLHVIKDTATRGVQNAIKHIFQKEQIDQKQ